MPKQNGKSTTGSRLIADGVGFSAERFEVLRRLTENHFWFAGRMRLVRKALRFHLPEKLDYALDLGCGPGHWLPQWTEFCHKVCGVDPFLDPESMAPTSRNIVLKQGCVDAVPVADNVADIVLMLDVLEHVDDSAAISEVVRVLKPGGVFIATVPAMPMLWSERDEAAGHLRRYTAPMLRALVEQSDLEAKAIQYYQSLLLPVVFLSRFWGRNNTSIRDTEDRPPPLINALFRSINIFEVNTGLRLPFGSSLLLVARKPSP